MAGLGSRAEARRHHDSSRRASLEVALRPMCELLLRAAFPKRYDFGFPQ